MPRPGAPLPYPELLGSPLPVAWTTGACLCGDNLNNAIAYIYYLAPGATAAGTTFWRMSITTGAWQRLADPIAAGTTDVVGIGTTLISDPSRPVPFNGGNADVWFGCPNSAAGAFYYVLRYYNAVLDTWTIVTQLAGSTFINAGLAAQWAGDAAAVHLCTTINGQGVDTTVIYLGNNAVLGYVHTIATGAITALPVGGARAAAPGNGLSATWNPALNANFIYSQRGGGNNDQDIYPMAGGVWATGIYAPLTQTFTTGASETPIPIGGSINYAFLRHDGDGMIYYATNGGLTVVPYFRMYTATGAPVPSRGIVTFMIGERTYILLPKPGTTEVYRARMIG